MLAAGVYQSGLLADPRPGAPHGHSHVPPALAARLRALRACCDRHAVPPLAAAVQFPLTHPAVVVGARTPAEVTGSAELLAHPFLRPSGPTLRSAGLLPETAPVPAS